MSKNRVSTELTTAQVNAINTAIATLKANMPGLVTLTRDDRRTLPKMGDKTVAFVNKATEYAARNASLLPPFVNMTEHRKDVNLVNQLKDVRRELARLEEQVSDTIVLAGSEAYSGSLAIYATVKVAANNRVEGAKTAYDDLKVRFPGRNGAEDFFQQQEQASA